MNTMYLLNWDSDDTNTDTYGSQISYQTDGSVHYHNELQPAGKKIHWWQTNYFGDPDPLQNSRYGSKRLPQIPRNQMFSLILQGDVTPQKSIGLTIRSFDETGQLLKQRMTLSDQLDFKLNDDEVAYEVALVKFNNTNLLFEGLLLVPETLQNNYQIQAHLDQGFIDLIPRENGHTGIGQMMIQQFHRVVDTIPISSENHKIPIRVVLINGHWNSNRLQECEKEFKNLFQLQEIKWSASDLKSKTLLNRVKAEKLKRK